MRRAQYIPTVVVGLVSFAGQAMNSQPCSAYDSIPAAALAEARDLDDTSYISDSAVQPAGYYDSRPRPRTAPKSQPGNSSTSSTANNKAPLYRGQKVRMPALPFGRQTATANDAARQRMPQQTVAPGLSAAQSSGPSSPRMPVGKSVPRSALSPNARVANNPMPRPMRPTQAPNTAVRTNGRTLPATRPVWPVPSASSSPPMSDPASALPADAQNPSPAVRPVVPMSPADRLATQAHELSGNAQSEQEFTQLAEICQQILANQPAPKTAQFAHNLLGWSLNRRGQLKAEAGQDLDAVADFAAAVQADPKCWRAIHNRGVLLAQAGQFEKAFDDFANTIRLNPKFAKAYSNRAALLLIADNLDAALRDYHQSIELDPNLAVSQRGCGRVCQLIGQLDEALTHYDAAVRLAPDDAFAAACRADLLTDLGRYGDAATEYDRALQLDAKLTQALTGSAWLLATCPDDKIRNSDLAIQRAQSAIEVGGENDALNLDTLAAAQANAGDFEAAMLTVRKAINLAPNDERAAYRDRLLMYERAKPFRIAPIEHTAQQANYETTSAVEGSMK